MATTLPCIVWCCGVGMTVTGCSAWLRASCVQPPAAGGDIIVNMLLTLAQASQEYLGLFSPWPGQLASRSSAG